MERMKKPMLKFEGTPLLHSSRLLLRPYAPGDAEAMFENWASDPRVTRFLTWTPHEIPAFTRQVLDAWVKGYQNDDYLHWGITLEGRLIGDVAVTIYSERSEYAELGYCLSHDAWGKGVMTEAVGSVTGYLFDIVGFHRVVIRHAVKNPASGRVAEKCGFRCEGVAREAFKAADGQFLDIATWAKLSRD